MCEGSRGSEGSPKTLNRDILGLLRHGARMAGAIAAEFERSRLAISRHLRVLREHGLVVDEARGRHRVYRLEAAAMPDFDDYLPAQQPFYERLDAS